MTYKIIDVTLWVNLHDEQMGSKDKDWFLDSNNVRWLYKQPRRHKHGYSGEDWAEKIAAELAEQLKLPHAEVELALRNNRPGSITRIIHADTETLIHGNELLEKFDANYTHQSDHAFTNRKHTVPLVMETLDAQNLILCKYGYPTGIKNALQVFVGYLMLDAWIGNTDRHHQNWAIVASSDGKHLAPTYDHGSSLGRNEIDTKRVMRLRGNDSNYTVSTYCQKTPSRFFDARYNKQLTPIEVFKIAAEIEPVGAEVWVKSLKNISSDIIKKIVCGMPSERMSDASKEFALAILNHNRSLILQIK